MGAGGTGGAERFVLGLGDDAAAAASLSDAARASSLEFEIKLKFTAGLGRSYFRAATSVNSVTILVYLVTVVLFKNNFPNSEV